MNKENVRKWVDALRSGKYKQGLGALQILDNYCCLGVACSVAEKNNCKFPKTVINNQYIFGTEEKIGILPHEVRNWLELDNSSPEIVYNTRKVPLVCLNDVEKLSFNEIADLIEDQWLKEETC